MDFILPPQMAQNVNNPFLGMPHEVAKYKCKLVIWGYFRRHNANPTNVGLIVHSYLSYTHFTTTPNVYTILLSKESINESKSYNVSVNVNTRLINFSNIDYMRIRSGTSSKPMRHDICLDIGILETNNKMKNNNSGLETDIIWSEISGELE